MNKRITITLPADTIELIDHITTNVNRSQFIDEAINFYAHSMDTTPLKQKLQEGAVRRAQRDLRLAEEWSTLE